MNTTNEIDSPNSETPATNIVNQQTAVKRKPRFWWFLFYLLPIVLVLIVGSLIQQWLLGSCADTPEDLRGECGAGWLQLIVVPVTYIASLLACLVATAGAIHLAIYCTSIYKETSKSLIIVLGVLLSIVVFVGGTFLADGIIFS